MIPWIIVVVVVVPLVVVAFSKTRRKTQPALSDADGSVESQARAERELADAEAYEAKWHDEDKERFHRERLP